MQYTTEDLTPVKKKITVTVPAGECDAALTATIALYRTSISLDGFRKGKVPASLIESRFHKEVYKEATTDLVNVHINEIISENKMAPVSRIDFDGGEIVRGFDFVYTIEFEVMPEFDLPDYEDFEVEQEEAEVNEEEIDAVIGRVRSNMADIVTVGETRTPADGEIAVLDFEAFDEKGEPIAGIKADNFQLTLGEGQTLPDFEYLIKTMFVGEEKEGPMSFPDDFFNKEFAGRTVNVKAKLHAIKERRLPELDDAFAQKAGGFESVEKLRDSVRQSYMHNREELNKSAAQKTLLDSLLKMVDFPIPESMLEGHINIIVSGMEERLERQGKNLASIGKSMETVREEVRPEAEMRARTHIFLLSVARARDLSVSEQEVDLMLRRMAMESGQDYKTVKDYYIQNNLLFALRDKILADKGMDEIYAKAVVKKASPKTLSAAATAPAAETPSSPDEGADESEKE